MTQEEKQLLLIDLCARLPFGVVLDNPNPCGGHWDELVSIDIPQGTVTLLYDGRTYKVEKVKPYLRPMSSLIGKELDECRATCKYRQTGQSVLDCATPQTIDYLISHHFDYRGLIPMGLALEAKEGMYGENIMLKKKA